MASDLAWWCVTVLLLLSWLWVTALLIGYVRLRRMLQEVERRRVLAEKARK